MDINFVPDRSGWVTQREMMAVMNLMKENNISISCQYFSTCGKQYLPDKYFASRYSKFYRLLGAHDLYFDYFHGDPSIDSNWEPIFKKTCDLVNKNFVSKIRLTNSKMFEMFSKECERSRFSIIPIGLEVADFSVKTESVKDAVRKQLGIPSEAFVVGSFQKDGDGWGDGMVPKLVKGPDILLKAQQALAREIPNLHVLLLGPSRGYVKEGLNNLGISYTHLIVSNNQCVSPYYDALDLYVISSREEGGPKGFFEAMAKKIPIATTNVGHVIDYGLHMQNCFIFDENSVGDLVAFAEMVTLRKVEGMLAEARSLAERFDYNLQANDYLNFLDFH